MLVLIHYGEIGLKGKNRGYFEEKLASNVRVVLEKVGKAKVRIYQKRIFAEFEGKVDEEKVRKALLRVFGIEWFAIATECKPELESIWDAVKGELGRVKGKKFGVKSKRSWKGFPMKSMELSGEIGGRIQGEVEAKVDLKNPEITVYVGVMQERAFVHFEKIKGLGGLPVGSSGKVLCLMSGGIDSPVAAWSLMKRGCAVDFLHVHPFESNSKVSGSKIEKLVRILDGYQQREGKLLLVPYSGFYARSGDVERRYELVVFRKYLYKLAEAVALKQKYLGIVSGDSLGQVASQTLENISAAQSGLSVPVFRPLVSMDKMEIVSVAERIGTYETSLGEYQDCCSLVSVKSPVTKARGEFVDRYFEKMGIEKLIEENLKEI